MGWAIHTKSAAGGPLAGPIDALKHVLEGSKDACLRAEAFGQSAAHSQPIVR